MAKVISMNSVKSATTLAAATAAMCINLNLNASDTAAAQAAMHDIAQDEGNASAKAIIIDMNNPYGGFYA